MPGDPVTVDGLLVQPAGAAVVARRENRVGRQQPGWPGAAVTAVVTVVDDLSVDDSIFVHVSLRALSGRAGSAPCMTGRGHPPGCTEGSRPGPPRRRPRRSPWRIHAPPGTR